MDAIIDANRTAHRARRGALGLVAVLALVLLAGCGGSGSSGFDALAAENDAIDRALQDGTCPVENGLTICASNQMPTSPPPSATRTPTGTPESHATTTPTPTGTHANATGTATVPPSASRTPTPLPPGRPSADVDFSPNDIANCAGTDLSQPCVLTVTFAVSNAPASAVYRAASRGRDPDTAWTLHPSDGPYAVIVVAPEVTTVQVAVLLFDGDPGELPANVELLADSGAQVAFVTEPVDVRAPAP